MPHITLEEHLPGITGLLEYRRDSAEPIRVLTQFLLRGPNTLTEAERELIATVVSNANQCRFCTAAHAATADALLGESETSACVRTDIESAALGEKMKALLQLAKLVQQSGQAVTAAAVERARRAGATDVEIHDTVLIAAAFCMFNRYVDGLGTWAPQDRQFYVDRAPRRAEEGYANYDPHK